MARLLPIEGDEAIGRRVVMALTTAGHQVAWQRTAAGAVAEAAHTGFDLVLLDFDVPDRDGAEVCRDLRAAQPYCVLIMLATGRNEMDAVVSLEAGADDYLGKPFGMVELSARVRAHLRRACVRDQVVTRDVLMADVWDRNWSGSTKTLDVHVGQVRRRLADAMARADVGARAPRITMLRGRGYRLDPVDVRE
jgi:DNA-binding response OmpR family regulator